MFILFNGSSSRKTFTNVFFGISLYKVGPRLMVFDGFGKSYKPDRIQIRNPGVVQKNETSLVGP